MASAEDSIKKTAEHNKEMSFSIPSSSTVLSHNFFFIFFFSLSGPSSRYEEVKEKKKKKNYSLPKSSLFLGAVRYDASLSHFFFSSKQFLPRYDFL